MVKEKEELINYILIGVTIIMLVISVFGLYIALSGVVGIWIPPKYSPLYHALMNLAVLIIAIYMLNVLIKKNK